MAQNTNIIDIKRLLILAFLTFPLHEAAPTNIDCNGKSFHCLNATHFMICVDLGGGVSSTVDDFVIPCPPTTICSPTNRFECEFPAPSETTTEAATFGTTIITTQQWESINYTATFPTSLEEHLGLQNSTTKVASETTSTEASRTKVLDENIIGTVTSVDVTTEAYSIETTILDTTSVTNSTEVTSDVNGGTIASETQDYTTESFLTETSPLSTTTITNSKEIISDLNNLTTVSETQTLTTEAFSIKTTTLDTTSDTNSTELISDLNNGHISSVAQGNLDVTTEAFVSGTTLLDTTSETYSTELNRTMISVEQNKLEVEASVIETTLPFDTTTEINTETSTSAAQNETEVTDVYTTGSAVPFNITTNELITSVTQSIPQATTKMYAVNITLPFVTTNDIVDSSTKSINNENNNGTIISTVTMEGAVETTMPFDTTNLVSVTEKSTLIPTDILSENYNKTESDMEQSNQDTTTAVTSIVFESNTKSNIEVSDVTALNESDTQYTTTAINSSSMSIIITENKNSTENIIDMKPTEVTNSTLTTPSSTMISTAMETIPVLNETFEGYVTHPVITSTHNISELITESVTPPITVKVDTLTESTSPISSNETEWLPETTSETNFVVDEIYSSEGSLSSTPLFSVTTEPDISFPTTGVDTSTIGMTQTPEDKVVRNSTEYDVNILQSQSVDVTSNAHAVQDKIPSTTDLPKATTYILNTYTTSTEASNSQNTTNVLNTIEDPFPVTDAKPTNQELNDTENNITLQSQTPDMIEVTTQPYNELNTNIYAMTEYPDNTVITENSLDLSSVVSTDQLNLGSSTETVTMGSFFSVAPIEAANTATIHNDVVMISENTLDPDKLSTSVFTEYPSTITFLTGPTTTDLNLETTSESTSTIVDITLNPTTSASPNLDGGYSQKVTQTTAVYNIYEIPSTPVDALGQPAGVTSNGNDQNTTPKNEAITTLTLKTTTSTVKQGNLDTTATSEDYLINQSNLSDVTVPITLVNTPKIESSPGTDQLYTTSVTSSLQNGQGVTENNSAAIESSTSETLAENVHTTAELMLTETTVTENSLIGSNAIEENDTLIYTTEPMNKFAEMPVYTKISDPTYADYFTTQPTPTETDTDYFENMEISTQNIIDYLGGPTAKQIDDKIDLIQSLRTTTLKPTITTTFEVVSQTTSPLITTDYIEYNTQKQIGVTTVPTITRIDDTNEKIRPGMPTVMPAASVGYNESRTQGDSLTTGISVTEAFPSKSTNISDIDTHYTGFDCKDRNNGRYPDIHDCRKFYTCNGLQVAVDHCPENTVFSDVKKKCTKDLSHCIRNKEFKCTSNGRFYDYFEQNTYYVCIKNTYTNIYVRFKFQCQNGYHFNKKTVACELDQSVTKTTTPFLKESIKATTQKINLMKSMEYSEFECEKEGKFPDAYDCRKYYQCNRILESEEFTMKTKYCDSDEIFHKEKKRCVDSESNECSRAGFSCENRGSGKYADNDDCKKFYACYGTYLAIRRCPQGTVFSDIKKQCTKDLSHCVRNNKFICATDGRFYDYFEENVYNVCVRNTHTNLFVRFKFQCQRGYHLDKATVKCEPNRRKTVTKQASTNRKASDDKGIKNSTKKFSETKNKSSSDFECEETGRFPDPNNCRKYYVCSRRNSEEFRRRRKKCDSDEVFDKDKKECVDAESYECS